MPVPFWAGRYIGLPFLDHGRNRSGLDCWGLVRLVMSEQFNLALPSFGSEYDCSLNCTQIGGLVGREIPKWDDITPGEETLGDVIVMRLRGQPMHIGLVLGDEQMLHIESGINSAIEKYTGPRWSNRVSGFYRYRTSFAHDS